MQLFIVVLGITFFIVIIPALFLITGKAFGDGTKLYIILSKLFASIFIHFLSGFVIFLMMIFITFGPEPRMRTKSAGEEIITQTICLLLVGVYGLIGYALCSFINGKLIKSISEFNVFYEKPQSILPFDYH